MQNIDANEILNKYRKGIATEEEISKLLSWVQNFESEKQVDLTIEDLETVQDEIWLQLSPLINQPQKLTIWPRLVAAAAILLFISVGGYFIFHKTPNQQVARNKSLDIAPGGNKATLTLSNGQIIVLTNAKNTNLAVQGNTIINKENDGTVTYTAISKKDKEELTYNTMTTPRGGKFNLILSDGTRVILNAASSIRYPVSFVGKERKVEITGEAYFEVAHNKAKPFLVSSREQTVEVLGTHFNISAYGDEPMIKTTLLEGSIKISKAGQMALISPGQQAQTGLSIIKVFNNADTEEAVAWTNGLFKFSHTDIKAVMRQFARWYDVDVDYEGKIPNDLISGKIYRNVKVSQALEILKYLNIRYRIEKTNGINKITITP